MRRCGQFTRRFVAFALALACAGCQDAGTAAAGDGGAGMAHGGAAGMGSTGNGAGTGPSAEQAAPTFSRVWNEVLLNKTCTNPFCHGLAVQGGLSMADQTTAYTSLVGVTAKGPACGASGKLRVVPFDPDASLIVDKLSHAMPACGTTMPPSAQIAPVCDTPDDPVSCNAPQEIQLVIDWIRAGAKND